jgi:SAM-dependent methyltransferase
MLNLDQQNLLRERYRLENPYWRPATETYAALVRSYLNEGSQVLDLGCGRGGVVEQLEHPPSLITGVDPDWYSLLEHRLDGIKRVTSFSNPLPFRKQSFDVVLASWLFEHLAQPGGTFWQMFNVLKPGGVLIFIAPNGRHPVAYLNRLFGGLEGIQGWLVSILYGRDQTDTFTTYYRANTVEQLCNLAEAAGFEHTTLITIPDPTYLAFTNGLYRPSRLLEESLPESRKIHLVGVFRRPGQSLDQD